MRYLVVLSAMLLAAPQLAHADLGSGGGPLAFFVVLFFFYWPVVFVFAGTILGWYATRLLPHPTARNFCRMLLLTILWTPVPVAAPETVGAFYLPSGYYLIVLALQSRASMQPAQMAQLWLGTLHLAIAVGTTCVLGACVLVARSLANLRRLDR